MILYSNLDEIMMPTNMKLIIPRQRIMSLCQSPPTSLITPSFSGYFSEDDQKICDDNNVQVHYTLLE
jgi:hypothetical protein